MDFRFSNRPFGSSTFRLSTTSVSMSLTGSRFSSHSAPRPLYWGFLCQGICQGRASFPSCFEHDGTLNAVAMTIRGEPAFGARFNRATTLYPVGPRTRTMIQSRASAAKLRSGGPILPFGVRAKGRLGIPPPRTVIGVPPQAYGQAETVEVPSASSNNHCAGRKTMPSGTTPWHTSRHRAISSLRAKATIMGLRAPRGSPCELDTTALRRSPSGTLEIATPIGPCLAELDHCRNGLTLSPGVFCRSRRVSQ
jgi:hypothetical protein